MVRGPDLVEGPLSPCPGRAATRSVAAQSRDQGGTGRGEMGPGSAAHHTGRCFVSPGVLRCVRGTRGEFDVGSLLACHCERSEAIQSLSTERFWIASSQGLLAMTLRRQVGSPCLAVIPRAGGESSTPRLLGSITAVSEYSIVRSLCAIAHWPGDDTECVVADAPFRSRGGFRPSFALVSLPSDPRGRREGRVPAGTRGPLRE